MMNPLENSIRESLSWGHYDRKLIEKLKQLREIDLSLVSDNPVEFKPKMLKELFDCFTIARTQVDDPEAHVFARTWTIGPLWAMDAVNFFKGNVDAEIDTSKTRVTYLDEGKHGKTEGVAASLTVTLVRGKPGDTPTIFPSAKTMSFVWVQDDPIKSLQLGLDYAIDFLSQEPGYDSLKQLNGVNFRWGIERIDGKEIEKPLGGKSLGVAFCELCLRLLQDYCDPKN